VSVDHLLDQHDVLVVDGEGKLCRQSRAVRDTNRITEPIDAGVGWQLSAAPVWTDSRCDCSDRLLRIYQSEVPPSTVTCLWDAAARRASEDWQ
jgi:hypothetical protein